MVFLYLLEKQTAQTNKQRKYKNVKNQIFLIKNKVQKFINMVNTNFMQYNKYITFIDDSLVVTFIERFLNIATCYKRIVEKVLETVENFD